MLPFQSFGVLKKTEHLWKSIIHDGDTVSVHRPNFYANRFQKFMRDKVFRKMPAPPTLRLVNMQGFLLSGRKGKLQQE